MATFENISNSCVCPENFVLDTDTGECVLGVTKSTDDTTILISTCGVEEVFDG